MEFKRGLLQEIDHKDLTFRYTLRPADRSLVLSIKESGLLQPVVVVEKMTGYIPVTGFRRLEAAEKAGLSEIPVLVLDKNVSTLQAFRLAFFDNLGHRILSIVEKSLVVKKFLDFGLEEQEIVKNVLTWLELPPNGLTVRVLLELAGEENLWMPIHEKNWRLQTVEKFLEFSRNERELVIDLISGLSLNQQSEIIDGFRTLKRRFGKSLYEILSQPEFCEIKEMRKKDRILAGEKLLEVLRSLVYPLVTRIRKEIDKEVKDLELPQRIKVEYDRSLEDNRLRIVLEPSSLGELKNLQKILSLPEKERHWQKLFDLLNSAEE